MLLSNAAGAPLTDIRLRNVDTTAEGGMAALGPLMGGLIASALGYTTLFCASIAFLVAALVMLIWFVQEPRHRKSLQPPDGTKPA